MQSMGERLSSFSSSGPCFSGFDHGVEDGEEFAHGGDEGDLGWLSLGAFFLEEGAQDGVLPDGDQRRHVED